MNRLYKWLCTSVLLLFSYFTFIPVVDANDDLRLLLSEHQQTLAQGGLPSASVIIESTNGQILWDENSDEAINPRFLSHVMTLYLTYEAIEQGVLTWEDTITVSDSMQMLAQIPGLPGNNLVSGTTYSVRELVELVQLTNSAGASFLLAEFISQTPDAFVLKMNQTAETLGLSTTIFTSPSGLSVEDTQGYEAWIPMTINENSQSTPKDFALLTYHLAQKYPSIFDISQLASLTLQADTYLEETFETNNPFIVGQEHAIKGTNGLIVDDALLTETSAILTTKQNGLSLITVIIGVNQESVTEQGISPLPLIGQTLIENAFAQYEYRQLLPAGTHEIQEELVVTTDVLKGVVRKDSTVTFELKEDQIVLASPLASISETLIPVSIAYTSALSEFEEEIEDNPFVKLLMNAVEITQLTIFAIGIILIGILIFIMSFFIPKKETEAFPEEEYFFDFETNEEVIPSRTTRLQQDKRSMWHTLPYRQITFYSGLSFTLLGIVLLIVQYLL